MRIAQKKSPWYDTRCPKLISKKGPLINPRRTIMNYKQNEKILQLTDDTLIVGVDIAKERHVARAQDNRGIQFGKPLYFTNDFEGFQSFMLWLNDLAIQNN